MNGQKRALLLVGSAKRPHSTSESLGRYLLGQLAGRGYETEALLIHRALKSDQGRGELLAAVERADLLLLAFPLYVDTLPALVIRALEAIAEHRRGGQGSGGGRLVAIANCGFPEASHNDTALAVCRRFAAEAGFEWAGGLALGGGRHGASRCPGSGSGRRRPGGRRSAAPGSGGRDGPADHPSPGLSLDGRPGLEVGGAKARRGQEAPRASV